MTSNQQATKLKVKTKAATERTSKSTIPTIKQTTADRASNQIKPKAPIKNSKPEKTIEQFDATAKLLNIKNSTKTKTTTTNNLQPNNKPITTTSVTKKLLPSSKQKTTAVDTSRNKPNSKQPMQKSIKPNAVLDSYHNVTVVSPPLPRKATATTSKQVETVSAEHSNKKLIRKQSRTLDPDEVVVLRRESAKKRLEEQIKVEQGNTKQSIVKEPVAFEVPFEKPIAKNKSKSVKKEEHGTENENTTESKDLACYESDFETGSSSEYSFSSEAEVIIDTSAESSDAEDHLSSQSDSKSEKIIEETEEEDESEFTQYLVTVIQRDKESDRKLDSGNYEINSRKNTRITDTSEHATHQFDSLDTFSTTTSEQLDSGISNHENFTQLENAKNNMAVVYGGYRGFYTRPIVGKRGLELLRKVQFDSIAFTLYEHKPTSYETYMRIYGQFNTTQTSTQTQENNMSRDSQTDNFDMRSKWTQHPPLYDIQTMKQLATYGNISRSLKNCCDESPFEEALTKTSHLSDSFENSLRAIANLQHLNEKPLLSQQLKRFSPNYERLHTFLLKSLSVVSKVLDSNNAQRKNFTPSELGVKMAVPQSDNYFKLNTKFLNALQVIRIFANARHNLIITVHESQFDANVYRSDFSNLLMLWSTSDSNKPLRLLSTWSEVCHAEICNECAEIVICGLRDGSVAMWDMYETNSHCSKLDGSLTHFAATQSIVPTWNKGTDPIGLRDLGAVVDVRSFRLPGNSSTMLNTPQSLASIQFVSLHDAGILTVWTLIHTAIKQYELSSARKHKSNEKLNSQNSKFEFSSPWARVKLIQSSICDLRDYIIRGVTQPPSPFEKTKALFEKNIYSDEVLRELSDTQTEALGKSQRLQGLRFSCIDTGCEHIYVCTNRNFILRCTKSLKEERMRRIELNNSGFLFPTALCVLTNEDFIAVGLSNGSVLILNCNQQNTVRDSESEPIAKTPNVNADQQHPPDSFVTTETGKSCAIQNLILSERRNFNEDADFKSESLVRPNTAACVALIANEKRPFELFVYDQQLILSGFVLRKHLVQSLKLSSDGWKMFVLSNGKVRTYDFYMDQEVDNTNKDGGLQNIIDIAVAKINANEQHLLVLNAKNEVEVHQLRK